VKWEIFSIGKAKKKGHEKDAMDLVIEEIEKFAPRKYRPDRDLYYYNYRSIGSYLKPLMTLLEAVVEWNQFDHDREELLHRLFVALKDFYDPRGRLSMSEALEDMALMRKLADLFLFFFNGREAPVAGEIRELFG